MTVARERGQVSGHYAGPVTRAIGFGLDIPIVWFLFALGVAAVVFLVNLVAEFEVSTDSNQGIFYLIALVIWTFFYHWLCLTVSGRTPGKALAGVRVVEVNGNVLTPRSAFVRTVVQPFSFLFFGLGYLPMLLSKERRAMHDYAAHSAVIYDWGDRPAEISGPLSRYLARRGVTNTEELDLRG